MDVGELGRSGGMKPISQVQHALVDDLHLLEHLIRCLPRNNVYVIKRRSGSVHKGPVSRITG
jgi:hypothetical protein